MGYQAPGLGEALQYVGYFLGPWYFVFLWMGGVSLAFVALNVLVRMFRITG